MKPRTRRAGPARRLPPRANAPVPWIGRPRFLHLLLVLTSLLVPFAIRADTLETPEPELTATGRATIYQDDLAGARERAVQAALVRGLEEASADEELSDEVLDADDDLVTPPAATASA